MGVNRGQEIDHTVTVDGNQVIKGMSYRDFRRVKPETELEQVRLEKAMLSKRWTGSTEDKTLWGQLCEREKGLSPVKYGSATNSNRQMRGYIQKRRLEDAQRRPGLH